jgi:hypothetical protein
MLEWLTLWPIWRLVPVSSQRRDMFGALSKKTGKLKRGRLREGVPGVKDTGAAVLAYQDNTGAAARRGLSAPGW